MSTPSPSPTPSQRGTAVVAPAAITAQDLSRRYGEGANAVEALHEVSLTVPQASFTAVMGPSGSGKSTLLHCLSGLDAVTSGRVFLGAVEITGMGERALTRVRREQVGFVFQAFNLMPSLTARENIVLPLQLAGRRPDQDLLDTVVDLLGLAERLDHRPTELSGGQMQRVAVARALITRPQVIFADEPTGNLDRRSGIQLLRLLGRCVTELDQTVVMVTHDPAAAAHAERVLFLADGRLAHDLAAPTLTAILDLLDAHEDGADQ